MGASEIQIGVELGVSLSSGSIIKVGVTCARRISRRCKLSVNISGNKADLLRRDTPRETKENLWCMRLECARRSSSKTASATTPPRAAPEDS